MHGAAAMIHSVLLCHPFFLCPYGKRVSEFSRLQIQVNFCSTYADNYMSLQLPNVRWKLARHPQSGLKCGSRTFCASLDASNRTFKDCGQCAGGGLGAVM